MKQQKLSLDKLQIKSAVIFPVESRATGAQMAFRTPAVYTRISRYGRKVRGLDRLLSAISRDTTPQLARLSTGRVDRGRISNNLIYNRSDAYRVLVEMRKRRMMTGRLGEFDERVVRLSHLLERHLWIYAG